jgi:DNA (cytosine-5)-methyltransferase 1
MTPEKPDVCEVFCGPGGQGLGFSPFFNVSQAFDISTPAVKTYQANHPETQVRQQDVRDLTGARADFDGIVGVLGGSPCQQWSRRNIHKKKNDPRAELPWEYLRIVEEAKPKFFVFENVTYAPEEVKLKFVKIAKSLGYNVTSEILNAAHYGAAQTRRRWIVVGMQTGTWSPTLCTRQAPRTVRMAFETIENNWGFMKSRPDTLEKLAKATTEWSPISEDGDYDTIIKLLPDKPSPTVVNVKKVYMVHPTEVRNISSAEAAALQGFPPGYTWHGDQHAIGQMIADAMPRELAFAIAQSIHRRIVA